MSQSAHVHRFARDILKDAEPPPPVKARFFYCSLDPIDDPLSPVPPPKTAKGSHKQPPRPFSDHDNVVLESAWLDLRERRLELKGSVDGTGEDGRRKSSPIEIPVNARSTTAASSKASTGQAVSTDALNLYKYTPQSDFQNPPEPLAASSLNSDTANVSGTTRNPFVRAPSRSKIADATRQEVLLQPRVRAQATYEEADASELVEAVIASNDKRDAADTSDAMNPSIPVGVSRLHQVQITTLQMTPIYWDPVQDAAQVVRATWFYQDTMLPVEPQIAIMLEAGYVDLRCWSDTWKDELACAVEFGAEGEEKIVHRLWPDGKLLKGANSDGSSAGNGSNLAQVATMNLLEEEPDTPERLREKAVEAASMIIDASVGSDRVDNKASGSFTSTTNRAYAAFGVIYSNDREARLLRPTLMPSAYYGRRPYANYIRKGRKLGIPVIRGFDQSRWHKIHSSKPSTMNDKAARGIAVPKSGVSPLPHAVGGPSLGQAESPNFTDLILVIHGIGQKLSQRVESFHFTHAINALRRDINAEVGNKEMRALFRNDMGNIMVLPINWRHRLSFEDGGYRDGLEDPAVNEFTLSDITPPTLPSIRNIVSDVMLDIPYYMSHHQPKMIAAVVSEANRVYQLWCRNNPGFAKYGRIHLIAHSLGSVMAVDILSRQPTKLPEQLSDPCEVKLETEQLNHFLFNTSNLFLAGSPAGFFLLLKKAQLLPRGDGSFEPELSNPLSTNIQICGERGQYGCLPIENLYNIINPYDPVAYRMNAAVDAAYSASLKQAIIPSATPAWFGVGTKSSSLFSSAVPKSPTQVLNIHSTGGGGVRSDIQRLPLNVELETHNFTREEIAEQRMLRLNDNGQIDFFLRYGGGAFDIPYFTMLGAHSSYWVLKDFVRMIVTETARPPGREGTFLGLRAVKRRSTDLQG